MNLSYLLSFLSPVYPFTFVLTSNLGPSFTVDPLFKQNKNHLKVIWQMMRNRNLFYLMVHLLLTVLGAAFQTVGDAFLT